MAQQGVVVRWSERNAWGFIRPDGAAFDDVFVHWKHVRGGQPPGLRLQVGARVQFELDRRPGERRPLAVCVERLS